MRFTEDSEYLDESIPLLDRAQSLLVDRDAGRIDLEGGYPAEVSEVGHYVVMATINYEGAPCLEIYKKTHLKQWFAECLKEFKQSNCKEEIVSISHEIEVPVTRYGTR